MRKIMIKEEQQKELKRLFDLYDECNQNKEMADEIYMSEYVEDDESDAFFNAQEDYQIWCRRYDDIVKDIKTFLQKNVHPDDYLEVLRQNFIDGNLDGEFKIDSNIPIPSERKLN
ncbi:hypothetical protein N9U90_05770 [Candidatus Pelagibacter sp.]|nr:hypothetical protein [Candidatus Pelagibacter sp.]